MSASTEQHDNFGIIAWFAANPVAANLLLVLVIVAGLLSLPDLRREAFPSMEPDSLTISMTYQSGSAKQSEESLAMPIEEALEGMPGVESVTSTSTGSGTTVSVTKLSNADLDELLRDAKNRVDAISTFPADAEKPVIEKAEREEHAIWVQLHGDASQQALQQLASDLKADLLAKPGINRTSEAGWRDPVMAIEIKEAELQALGLSLDDVQTAINAGSSSPMTAVIRSEKSFQQLQASEQAYQTEEFANIPLLVTQRGQTVSIGEIATVTDGWDETSSTLMRFNGEPSIGIQVITTGLDDISNTVDAAREVISQWQTSGKLPANVQLSSWYDRSDSINKRLALLVRNAASGMLLVFILLAVFLNLQVAFWVAMGLPFVFFGTFYLMGDNVLGLSMNEFTTFGFILALGIVVDDAVVVGESIYTVRSRDGDTLQSTIHGVMRVAVPTLFGVLTTVAAFFALSNVEGGLGNLYAQFASIVAICLLLSVVESKLILPSHLAHLNTRRHTASNGIARTWVSVQNAADNLLQNFSAKIYVPAIGVALRYRYAVLLLFIAFAVFIVALPLKGVVRISFFPEIPGDTVRAELTMHSDVPFGLTHQNLRLMEQRVYETDKRLQGDSFAGSAIANLQVQSSSDHSGKITVELSDTAPYDIKRFTSEWRTAIGMLEGAKTLSVQSRPGMVSPLRIELRASDDEVLERAGSTIKTALQAIPAISGIEDNLTPGQPQSRLRLTAEGSAAGITESMLATQVHQAFNGQIAQRFQRYRDEVEVRVRYPEDERSNPSDLLNSRIRTSEGVALPMSVVATIEEGYVRDSITRIDSKRAAYISADIDKSILSSTELVAQLEQSLVPQLRQQYPGLDIKFAGEAEEQAETQSSMSEMFLLAMLVIYILLAIPLKSYVQPFIIMTAIPFGIVGAIIGHWMNDLSLGILSFNGIVALSGVVVNDSLLLVSRYNQIKPDFEHRIEAVIESGTNRMRAVLLTSLTTFAGLVPLLTETERQAQFLIPAAVSIAYGIMFATVITLILIPVLLMIDNDIRDILVRLRRRPDTSEKATASC